MLFEFNEAEDFSPAARRLARALHAIGTGNVHSRSELSAHLGLRSASASHVVGELVERGLVEETISERVGRGRPAAQVSLRHQRLGASVVHLSDSTLVGGLIDMSGSLLVETSVPVDRETDNSGLVACLGSVTRQLRRAVPRGMIHAGNAAVVSGIVDRNRGVILAASRWPFVHDVDVARVMRAGNTPALVSRILEAEVQSLVRTAPERYHGRVTFVHWGWGIGLTQVIGGQILDNAGAPFGEIGHWTIESMAGRLCTCGTRGCLETGSALWVILPILRARWPELPDDETELGEALIDKDVESVPEARLAAELVARAIANYCRILFPERVAIACPLLRCEAFWNYFRARFADERLLCGLPSVPIVRVEAGRVHALRGAAQPLVTQALWKVLADNYRRQ